MSQAQSSILVSMNINWTKEIMIKYRVFHIWLWTLYETYVQLSSGAKKRHGICGICHKIQCSIIQCEALVNTSLLPGEVTLNSKRE